MDLAALRVDALEDALDGAVLAGGVHALEDQQHRPAALRVELFLEITQPFVVGLDDLLSLALVDASPLSGLLRFEVEFARSVEAERRHKRFQLGYERLRRLLAHDWMTPFLLGAHLRFDERGD